MELLVQLFKPLEVSFEVLDSVIQLALVPFHGLGQIFYPVVVASVVELQLQFVDDLFVLDLAVEQLLDFAHAVPDDQFQLSFLQCEHLLVPGVVAAVPALLFACLL